jgi:hypothetical protein
MKLRLYKPPVKHPPCFDSLKQYQEWHEQAHLVVAYNDRKAELAKHAHCEDCTPKYKARMIREGRCTNI